MSQVVRKKVALWFRYGAADHAELFHAMPELVRLLDKQVDVHYFGMKGACTLDPATAARISEHTLPFRVNRASSKDKMFKTLLWYLFLPVIGIRCRLMKIDTVFIDESLPLLPTLSRLFFGKKRALVVADFFADIYFGEGSVLGRFLNSCDASAWRKCPVLFTKTHHTARFLETKGIPTSAIHTVYDPCNTEMYFPRPQADCRQELGYGDNDLILVHHGILHPNKGLDRIISALPELVEDYPQLQFLIVGDGPHRKQLEDLTHTLQLSNHVRFTGWLKLPTDVNTALCAGDIGLVMRIGLDADHFHVTGTLVHNMASQLPVLCARLAGIQEIVEDGQCGYLFNPSDMSEFQSQFKKLADNPEHRLALAQDAYKRSQTFFALEKVALQTATPILDLIESE